MLTSSPSHTILKKIAGTWWGFFGKGNEKREIFLKNLGLYNEKGQSDQEHFYFIFYCGFFYTKT